MATLQLRPIAMTNNNPLAAWDAVVSPVDETPEQRRVREEARKTSARIDDELKAAHRAVMKKRKEQVKVLVLGQSESGASTRSPPSNFALIRRLQENQPR